MRQNILNLGGLGVPMGGLGIFLIGARPPWGRRSPPPIPLILDNPATILDHESDLGSSLQYITDHKSTF